MGVADWFLAPAERGNPDTRLDERVRRAHGDDVAWSEGNRATPLIHGATYYADLVPRIRAMGPGDYLFFTDWRGDPDERLLGTPGSEVSTVLEDAARRGVDVRGLIWRSHWDRFGYTGDEARHLGEEIEEAGGECLRDMRVRTMGSHHQKFVVLRHPAAPERDVAYVGGIDLCHSRRDDDRHLGDPQPQKMSPCFGPTPPWHDVQVRLRGPVVADVETVFRERWEDSNPLTRNPVRRLQSWVAREDQTPDPLPPQAPAPVAVAAQDGGTHCVQLLRTYPDLYPGYDFARDGERSVARGYGKALRRAWRLVYIEDQYLWSHEVAADFVDLLRDNPELRVIAVLPLLPDDTSTTGLPPNVIGRERAVTKIRAAAPDRVAIFGIENEAGIPIYVHAKVCIVDDAWATIGSDNFNRRSWTHDSELTAAVYDTTYDDADADGRDDPGGGGTGGRSYAVRLRTRLVREHLGLDPTGDPTAEPGEGEPDLTDPLEVFRSMYACADALDAWHAGGRVGPRPRGRLRHLVVPELTRAQRAWATPLYENVYDPDGRPRALKRARAF